jgi:hypothetical protein
MPLVGTGHGVRRKESRTSRQRHRKREREREGRGKRVIEKERWTSSLTPSLSLRVPEMLWALLSKSFCLWCSAL